MTWLDDDRRSVLMLEYETLHRENWERGQNTWVVNTILITGSLIVAFQSQASGFPVSFVPMFLTVIAFMMHWGSSKLTEITYERMEEIREEIGMTGPTTMYRTHIEGRWWHLIRRNLPYTLYLGLAWIYLFRIVEDFHHTLILPVAGLLLIILKEFYYLVRRNTRHQRA